jgi:trk system potassium uptake protein TrkH
MSMPTRTFRNFIATLFQSSPSRIIVTGFILLILIGSLLLSLPICSASGQATSYIDSLFTSASSVCVTGLVAVDTNTHWSFAGKAIILVLIQIGAVGVMSVVCVVSMLAGRSISLKERIALRESLSQFTLKDIFQVYLKALLLTMAFEFLGAILFCFVLVPRYGWASGIGKSVFHAVSSFCNAGFDLFGSAGSPFASLTAFRDNYFFLAVTAFLIVFGGLGFLVWLDILSNKRFTRYSLHTKIVLLFTLALLVVGSIGYFVFEYDRTLQGMPFPQQIANSVFHSVTARTAGFNTLDVGAMSGSGQMLTIVLMFIGGAPGSTAGGIKVTTMFLLLLAVMSYLRGKSDVSVFQRTIPSTVLFRSISIFILGLFFVLCSTFVLLSNQAGNFMQSLLESASAFGTVGLSTGITPSLNVASKAFLIATMIVGRIGTITVIVSILSWQMSSKVKIRYPEENIIVG